MQKLAFTIAIAITVPIAAPSAGAVSLDIGPDHAVVSGVSPGGSIVVVSIESAPSPQRQFLRRKRTNQVLDDHDRDGIVAFPMTAGQRSYGTFWAIVDLATGSLALSAPDWKSAALEGRGFEGSDGALTRLATRFHYVEALVVRPGVGAWTLSTGDGGPAQEGPPGRGVRQAVSHFMSVAGEHRLHQVLPSDTVLLIEPARFRFLASEGVGR